MMTLDELKELLLHEYIVGKDKALAEQREREDALIEAAIDAGRSWGYGTEDWPRPTPAEVRDEVRQREMDDKEENL